MEKENGYTWDNFNQYSLLSEFSVCEEKEFKKRISKKEGICKTTGNQNELKITNLSNIPKNGDKLNKHPSIEEAIKQKRLRDEYNNLKNKASISREKEIRNDSPKVYQYKSKGVQNIYAPRVRKEMIDKERAKTRGIRDGIKVVMENQNRLNKKVECFPPVNIHNIDNPINLAQYNPIKETQKLYTFKSIPSDINKDCFYCEKLFNNQTKRKHITPRSPF